MMARRCVFTGKSVLSGNNVSHANNRTRRRYLPNMQNVTLLSEYIGEIRLTIPVRTLRTIEKNGGIDGYLLGKGNSKLSDEAIALKKKILKIKQSA
jgi:large subunit ribosomal protein L28